MASAAEVPKARESPDADVERLQGFRSGTLVKIAKALKVPPFRLFMVDAEWAKWKKK